jgi:uncharacterized protein YdiU (UPF0061 family)
VLRCCDLFDADVLVSIWFLLLCLQVYEKNIHETLQSFLKLREERAADYDRTFTLISKNDHARERRRKVFDYFSEKINQANCFQTEEVKWLLTYQCTVLHICLRIMRVDYTQPDAYCIYG